MTKYEKLNALKMRAMTLWNVHQVLMLGSGIAHGAYQALADNDVTSAEYGVWTAAYAAQRLSASAWRTADQAALAFEKQIEDAKAELYRSRGIHARDGEVPA